MTSAPPTTSWPAGTSHTRPTCTDYLLAAVMFAAGLFVIGVGLVDVYTDALRVSSPLGRWWHAVPLGVMCLLLPLRRRYPLRALGAAFTVFIVEAVFGGSIGTLLVIFEFLYCGALYGARRVVRALSILIMVAVPVSAALTYLFTRDLVTAVLMALQVFAVFGASFWWGASTRTHVDLLALDRHRALDQAREARLREARAVAAERQRMAMDLHDALSGNLAAITIHSEAAMRSPQVAAQALETIRVTSRNAMGELQDMLDLLRATDPERTAPPTLADLPVLLERVRGQGVRVEFEDERGGLELPTAADQAAYRIIQEALANAARHAPGAAVHLRLGQVGTDLVVRVSSELPAEPPAGGSGHGLAQMRQRAGALGGHLDAGPQDGRWVVTATLPSAVRGADTVGVAR